jgi:hypothetical protein
MPVRVPRPLLALVGASALVTVPAWAQQANPSSAAYGMGDNYTAMARDHHAIAWNAAALGLKGSRRFSIGLLGAGSDISFSPVALGDFGGGGTLSKATRESWLTAIRNSGSQTGEGFGGLNLISLSFGRVGIQASGVVTSRMDLNPDAMEALLFGNAGLTGQPKTLNFSGSSLRVAALGTIAGSVAIPIGSKGDVEQSIGLTGKMVTGVFSAVAQDGGTAIAPSAVDVRFPIVHTNTDNIGSGGSGYGADLSIIRKTPGLTIAATVMNVVNTFAWDAGAMVARTGAARFDGNANSADFDEKAYSTAPAAVQTAVENYVIKPTLSLGLARTISSGLTIAADVRQQMGDSTAIMIGPRTHAGVGFELHGIPGIRLRGGASYITGGYSVSGGAGLQLGGFSIGGSIRYRQVNGAGTVGVMFSL